MQVASVLQVKSQLERTRRAFIDQVFFLALHEILLFLNENRKKRRKIIVFFPFIYSPFVLISFLGSVYDSLSQFSFLFFNFITTVDDTDDIYTQKTYTQRNVSRNSLGAEHKQHFYVVFSPISFPFLFISFHKKHSLELFGKTFHYSCYFSSFSLISIQETSL